ncbi:NACHT domain-containing protein [Arthrobacter sp. 2RAF22]|uniref:NACHT domain-containing protein n=1 Tax=Arthrobacter sp. 2RAF22 TaxID=3232996 RepID=UPI003F9353AB
MVLLGPPGSGKSTFAKEDSRVLPSTVDVGILRVTLDSIGTEDRFVRALTVSPRVAEWLSGSGELCVVLDGFDEAQQRIPHLASILMEILDEWPLERLWLRITCRTAEWPAHLGKWVKDLPDSEVVEIAPLRRVDAVQAAGDLQDPEGFIAAVTARGLAPLAAMPLSLELLVLGYQSQGRIPENRADAYAAGLRALCDEQSPQRRTSSANLVLPTDVLSAAESTAACMLFSAREALWAGAVGSRMSIDLAFDDISHFLPETMVDKMAVLTKMSRSALFQGSGPDRLTWAHATFPEFLAARWCIGRQLDRSQIRSLLCAEDGKLFPRVRRIAAWLVSMRPDRFRWICEADPQAVADEIDVPDDSLRAAVLEALLEEVARGNYIRDWGTKYENLRHASVADQLRPWLRSENETVRSMAVELAGETKATELARDLLSIALDPSESHLLRYRSILALQDVGWTGADLLALLESPDLLGEDDNSELRGAIIDLSHPQSLTTSEALRYVAVEPSAMFFGHYSMAVHRLTRSLSSVDLAAAANWLRLPIADAEGLQELRDAALGICADHLDDPMARSAALDSVRARLHTYQPVIGQHGVVAAEWQDQRRHSLLLMLASECSDDELLALVTNSQQDRVLQGTDFGWLVDQLQNVDETTSKGLIILIGHIFNPHNFDHANCLASLPTDHVLVTGALSYWCGSVVLDSQQAREQRATWVSYRRPAKPSNDQTVELLEEVNGWIRSNLDLFDDGDLNAFGHALYLVTVLPGTRTPGSQFQPDLTQHQRWPTLDSRTRQRLISGAADYLTMAKCQPEIWRSAGRLNSVAVAGYRALVLLLHTSIDQLSELSSGAWEDWAPVVVLQQPTINGVSTEDHASLLLMALPHARNALVRSLLWLIREDDKTGHPPLVERDCELLWGADLETELVGLLESVSDPTAGELAETLLKNDSSQGRTTLETWLQPASTERTLSQRRIALTALMRHSAESSWSAIRGTLDNQPDVAVASVIEIADRNQGDLGLSDEYLGYFLMWMERRFPRKEDPEFTRSQGITPRDQAARWRDRILQILTDRGTPGAIEALQSFANSEPSESWRREIVARAKRSHRQNEWKPIELDLLARLGSNDHTRIVRNLEELRESVLETLAEIQERLIGDTPESHLLWDTRVMQPKSEDEVCDYLLQKFRDRLTNRRVVINREVQVRRNAPSGIPERTDILIEAPGGGRAPLRVVIETKGAWNEGLDTAIPDQLIGRYLHDFPLAHGIYVVLWPDVGSWSTHNGTRDRSRVAALNRPTIERNLSCQAQEGHRTGHPVDVIHLDLPYRRPSSAAGEHIS